MLLNTKQIMEIIPHRHPFLLVDTIESMIREKVLLDINASHMTSRFQRTFS